MDLAMDRLSALPPELLTRIVDFVGDSDEARNKANVYVLRRVSRHISRCSRDAMLTAHFGHIRVLYTRPALLSLIELCTFSDVVAKIRKITIALVAPKWRECAPDGTHGVYHPVPAVENVSYSDTGDEEITQMLPLLDQILSNLRVLDPQADLGIFSCAIHRLQDFGDWDGPASSTLATFIGGRRVLRPRWNNRPHCDWKDFVATRTPGPTQTVALLLRALSRTGYQPKSLDLEACTAGFAASLHKAFQLPQNLFYPVWPRLVSLLLRLDREEFNDQGLYDEKNGTHILASWLKGMPALRSLTLRFAQNHDEYLMGDMLEPYAQHLNAVVAAMQHAQLYTLILDSFRFAPSALTQLLQSQAHSLQRLSLIHCEAEGEAEAWCSLFAWMAAHLTLTDFIFFNCYDKYGDDGMGRSTITERHVDRSLPSDTVSWWCTGGEAVTKALTQAAAGGFPRCNCADCEKEICCKRLCKMKRDVQHWTDFAPIAWSALRGHPLVDHNKGKLPCMRWSPEAERTCLGNFGTYTSAQCLSVLEPAVR